MAPRKELRCSDLPPGDTDLFSLTAVQLTPAAGATGCAMGRRSLHDQVVGWSREGKQLTANTGGKKTSTFQPNKVLKPASHVTAKKAVCDAA